MICAFWSQEKKKHTVLEKFKKKVGHTSLYGNAGVTHSRIKPTYARVCDFWPMLVIFVATVNWICVTG